MIITYEINIKVRSTVIIISLLSILLNFSCRKHPKADSNNSSSAQTKENKNNNNQISKAVVTDNLYYVGGGSGLISFSKEQIAQLQEKHEQKKDDLNLSEDDDLSGGELAGIITGVVIGVAGGGVGFKKRKKIKGYSRQGRLQYDVALPKGKKLKRMKEENFVFKQEINIKKGKGNANYRETVMSQDFDPRISGAKKKDGEYLKTEEELTISDIEAKIKELKRRSAIPSVKKQIKKLEKSKKELAKKNMKIKIDGVKRSFDEIFPYPPFKPDEAIVKFRGNDGKLILGMLPDDVSQLKGNRAILSIVEDLEIDTKVIGESLEKRMNDSSIDLQEDWIQIRSPDYQPVKDGLIDKGADWINDHINKGKDVLVHCKSGKGRSATLMAAYLIKYKGLNPVQAIAWIKAQRGFVSIAHDKGHMRAIQKYAESLGYPPPKAGKILGEPSAPRLTPKAGKIFGETIPDLKHSTEKIDVGGRGGGKVIDIKTKTKTNRQPDVSETTPLLPSD